MKTQFVAWLPDLIDPEDYASDPSGGRVRLRLRLNQGDLEILGDAANPQHLEALFAALEVDGMEQMLCG